MRGDEGKVRVSALRVAIGERGRSRRGGGEGGERGRSRKGGQPYSGHASHVTVGIRWNPWQSRTSNLRWFHSHHNQGRSHLELEMVPLDLLVEREGLRAAQVLHLRLHGLTQLLTRALVPEQVRSRVVFPDGTPEHRPIERRRRLGAHLMREAIMGHQRSSQFIRASPN